MLGRSGRGSPCGLPVWKLRGTRPTGKEVQRGGSVPSSGGARVALSIGRGGWKTEGKGSGSVLSAAPRMPWTLVPWRQDSMSNQSTRKFLLREISGLQSGKKLLRDDRLRGDTAAGRLPKSPHRRFARPGQRVAAAPGCPEPGRAVPGGRGVKRGRRSPSCSDPALNAAPIIGPLSGLALALRPGTAAPARAFSPRGRDGEMEVVVALPLCPEHYLLA